MLVVALVDDLDDDSADRLIAGIAPLVRHDPRLEIEVRRELAFDLASVRDQRRAIGQMSAALARARAAGLDREELELGADLAALFRESRHDLEAEAVLANTAERVSSRREHATGVERAEELVERGAFEDARTLLEQLPPADDDREARALLDEIRRHLGEHVPEPTETPDTEPSTLDGRVRAFVTRPSSLAQGVLDGGLLGADKLHELSCGAIEDAADLESQVVFGPLRSYRCACGRYRGRLYAGLVCRRCRVEVTTASTRRIRCGHVELAARVIHPWYEAAAVQLLDRPDAARLPADALAAELAAIDIDALAAQLKQTIGASRSNKLANQAGQRLALVDAVRRARAVHATTPDAIVLTNLLVIPPAAALGLDHAAVRAAYARIVEATPATVATEVRALFSTFHR